MRLRRTTPCCSPILSAFYNEALGEDRLREAYLNKERFGKLMKIPPSLLTSEMPASSEAVLKPLLNSASGAGDTEFEGSPHPYEQHDHLYAADRPVVLLMTDRLRLSEGARIISTNTDGLYRQTSTWRQYQGAR